MTNAGERNRESGDDDRERCEECSEIIAEGQAVHRCEQGRLVWHAVCGAACVDCVVAEGKAA